MRMWTARTTAKKALQYVEHMIRRVFPLLRTMEGHQETYLLRCKVKGAIESALTLGEFPWMLCEGVSGMALDKAVVEPEARAILTSCGDPVTHFEIIRRSEPLLTVMFLLRCVDAR